MQNHLKIGIIQNAPLTADFPGNLRSIVQGYRECLDHGAELVIASATALCGPAPGALTERRSFLKQTQAALAALSHELGSAPLLLGAYAPLFADDAEDWELLSLDGGVSADSPGEPGHTLDLVPFLIEKDSVTELADAEVTAFAGITAYIDICEGEVLPETEDFELLIHLADSAWHADAARQEEESRLWEARSNNVPVVWVQAVGSAGSSLYAGGSAIYTPKGKTLLRLPFFETANRVADLSGQPQGRALPRPEELLEQALIRGIRDSAHQNGYNAVCLPLDHPNAPLLAALCAEALGASNVLGITMHAEGSTATAEALGIAVERLDATPLLAAAKADPGTPLARRLQAGMLTTLAEDKGYMLLCPLGRHEIMLGQFTLYGDSCGQLAPLGNLYRVDIHLLTQRLSERRPSLAGTLAEPERPELDRIIHELADRNIAASELLANNSVLFTENDVRMVQRRLIASAAKRAQLPTILRVDSPGERLELPLCHRMND